MRSFDDFEYAFHALGTVAFQEQQLVPAIEGITAGGGRREADFLDFGSQFLVYLDAGLRRINDQAMGDDAAFQRDAELHRNMGFDDDAVRPKEVIATDDGDMLDTIGSDEGVIGFIGLGRKRQGFFRQARCGG